MIPFKEENNAAKICFFCQTKFGLLSFYQMNKNACFLCGFFVSNLSKKNVYYCLKHQKNTNSLFIQCSICNAMIQRNQQEFMKPIDAKLCDLCLSSDFKCCSLD
jgi:hypothetical protein